MTAGLLDTDADAHDNRVVLGRMTWADYQRLLAVRGDRSAPRFTYDRGRLEIMSPSRNREQIKSRIGTLVEVFCVETGIDCDRLGSWTLSDETLDRAIEPDECYVFGAQAGRNRPDLAIEVVWTSGPAGKLSIYLAFGVHEVWYWQGGRLTAWILRGDEYQEDTASEVLPGIRLDELCDLVSMPSSSAMIREYQARLRGRRGGQ